MSKLKLHVGCGTKYLKGYINIDLIDNVERQSFRKAKIDFVADALHLDNHYRPNTVDEIKCDSMIEHIGLLDIHHLFYRWNGIMKKGGVLRLVCPDYEACSRAIISSKYTEEEKEQFYRHVFGSQVHDSECHRGGFTKGRLKWFLKVYGFSSKVLRTVWVKRKNTYPYGMYKNKVAFPDIDCVAVKVRIPNESIYKKKNTPQNYRRWEGGS